MLIETESSEVKVYYFLGKAESFQENDSMLLHYEVEEEYWRDLIGSIIHDLKNKGFLTKTLKKQINNKEIYFQILLGDEDEIPEGTHLIDNTYLFRSHDVLDIKMLLKMC